MLDTKRALRKIITWNVNSMNSRALQVIDLIKKHNPDVLLLQELKCVEEKFPFSSFEDLGYNIKVFGQKSYNGVAIFSKTQIEDVKQEVFCQEEVQEARYIQGFTKIGSIDAYVASIYVPNGLSVESIKFRYKLKFLEAVKDFLVEQSRYETPLIVGGDFNVAPEEIDVYNAQALEGSIGFHLEERKRLRSIINSGFVDAFRVANPNCQEFSWWDYRSGSWQHNKGMRIDHILLSAEAADLLSSASIDTSFRSLSSPSDHTPVICELKG